MIDRASRGAAATEEKQLPMRATRRPDRRTAARERARLHDAHHKMPSGGASGELATAARLAKARENRKDSCRLAHSENPGYVYFLH
jgi:hypothetical protein